MSSNKKKVVPAAKISKEVEGLVSQQTQRPLQDAASQIHPQPPPQPPSQTNLLLQEQINFEKEMLGKVKGLFPKSLDTLERDKTTLKVQYQWLFCGDNYAQIQSDALGQIDFKKQNICEKVMIKLKEILTPTSYHDIDYKLKSRNSPVSIEQCCDKTTVIRYNEIIIGRVQKVVHHFLSTSPKYIIKPADTSKGDILLQMKCDCSFFLNKYFGKTWNFPINIQVIRINDQIELGSISNTSQNQCCQSCKKPICLLQDSPYCQGDIQINKDLQSDEKVLIICAWIIYNIDMQF